MKIKIPYIPGLSGLGEVDIGDVVPAGPPDALAYYDAAGVLTGDALLTAIPLDAYQRPQLHDKRLGPTLRGAIWRQGAWSQDGDPDNVVGEGLVCYGANALGNGPDALAGGYFFSTPYSFGRYQVVPGVNGGNTFLTCGFEDGSVNAPFGYNAFLVTDNQNNVLFEVDRGTGTTTIQNILNDASAALIIDRVPTAPSSGPGITINMGPFSGGDAIQIVGVSTGRGINIVPSSTATGIHVTAGAFGGILVDLSITSGTGKGITIVNAGSGPSLEVVSGSTKLNGTIGVFGAAPVGQQTAPTLVNNITAGGVNDTLANYADLVVYANDAAAIRNDLYQLGRKLEQLIAGVHNLGWFA